MKEGKLYYDGSIGRYDIRYANGSFYGGFHSGETLEVKLNSEWQATRLEYSHGEDDSIEGYWYFVGLDTSPNEVCLYGYPVRK